MDDEKFGGINALEKGVTLRKADTIYKNVGNVKSNSDLKTYGFNVQYSLKAPAGYYGLTAHKDIHIDAGVSVRLNGDDNDKLELIIPEDLTGLDRVQMMAHGHVVE